MKLALVQFNPVVGSPGHNADRMVGFLEAAKQKGAEVVLFGELALTGYYAQDQFYSARFIEETKKAWGEIKHAAKRIGVGVGVGQPRSNPAKTGAKHLFNSFRFYWHNHSEFDQDKVCIPTYGEFDEYRWFESAALENIKPRKFRQHRIGFVICEDGWNNAYGVTDPSYRLYSDDPIAWLMKSKADALINISASPDYMGKHVLRLRMNQRIAKHYKIPIVFLNIVGAQDELVFGGQSFVLDAAGNVMVQFKIGVEQLEVIEFPFMKKKYTEKTIDPFEELDGLVGLYLRDYFAKSKLSQKTVVGLSGGKDSTLVATLLSRHLDAKQVTAILMPYRQGEYTHDDSLRLAKQLAQSLKINTKIVPIDELVEPYIKALSLKSGSLTHQNLQARVRATILWAIANETGSVVMNTTNFSEAATGYGTIGGDLLGLPLIASLPATVVVRYLAWLKDHGVTALTDEMIYRKPTAELAPGQFDEHELGSYTYIDPILEAIRMNFGDLQKTAVSFMDLSKTANEVYAGSTQSRNIFFDKLSFLAKKILISSEFKRWYYHKTPQFTPYSWLRWRWPIANAHMDIDSEIETLKKQYQ